MSSMTPQRYEQVRSLFNEVCDLDPLNRSAILDDRCANDTDLRNEVESLLAEEQSGEFLDRTRAGLIPRLLNQFNDAPTVAVPKSIGKFEIIRVIGQGGMGTVYEARQENPRRSVALKIVQPRLASEMVMQRLINEAHMLARLQHVGIAQVFEAGIAETWWGEQPFFAMELIQGKPLLDYAKTRELTVPQRLELMARVADAIQHAHAKGVIHRDLKPSNILVVETGPANDKTFKRGDTRIGQPKILDFGVARATDSDLQAITLNTAIGQLIGTVAYMSPEQASGDPDRIDTRSDVYSLGVICFELLTGRHPLSLERTNLHDALQLIREAEPMKLGSIHRRFSGEIETIVSRAMERDGDRRYQSAADFSADLRRYLNDEPIFARPATAIYQLRKFARRHKAVVSGVTGVVLTLAAGIVATTFWAVEAIQQRDRARDAEQLADARRSQATDALKTAQQEELKAKAVIAFFQEMLSGASPNTAMGRTMTVKDLLDEAAERSISEFEANPTIRAAVEMAAGVAYLELGDLDKGERHISSVVETRTELLGADHPQTLEAKIALSQVLEARSQYAAALVMSRETSLHANAALGVNHDLSIKAANSLGQHLRLSGNWKEAEQLLSQTLALAEQQFSDNWLETIAIINNLALVYSDFGELNKSLAMQTRAVELNRNLKGPLHPHTLSSADAVALKLQELGRYDDSMKMYEEVLRDTTQVFGAEHFRTLLVMQNMSITLGRAGKFDEAEKLLSQALDGSVHSYGERHRLTMTTLRNMGQLLIYRGRYSEAEDHASRALDLARDLLGEDHPEIEQYLLTLATAIQYQGRAPEAIEIFRTALALEQANAGHDHPSVLVTINNLGNLLSQVGNHAEAAEMLEFALAQRIARLGAEHPQTLTTKNNLGLAYRGLKRHQDAEKLFADTLETRERTLGRDHPDTLTALSNLGLIASDTKNLAAAEKIFADLVERRTRVLGATHPLVAQTLRNLAWTIHKQQRVPETLPFFKQVVDIRAVSLGETHELTIEAIRDLASVYREVGDFDSSLATLDRAIAAAKQAYPAGSRPIITLQAIRAVCLAKGKRFGESEPALIEAHRLVSADYGPEHAQTQAVLTVLLEVLDAIGDAERAKEYRVLLIRE